MTLREILIAETLKISSRQRPRITLEQLTNSTDKQLFIYYRDCLYHKAFYEGFDRCCQENPEENITYLV